MLAPKLAELMSEYDPILASHLKTLDTPRGKYTSPTIQNKMIQVIGGIHQRKLLSEIEEARFYDL